MGCFNKAIYDAMGMQVDTLPLSYENVWRALKKRRKRKGSCQSRKNLILGMILISDDHKGICKKVRAWEDETGGMAVD